MYFVCTLEKHAYTVNKGEHLLNMSIVVVDVGLSGLFKVLRPKIFVPIATSVKLRTF